MANKASPALVLPQPGRQVQVSMDGLVQVSLTWPPRPSGRRCGTLLRTRSTLPRCSTALSSPSLTHRRRMRCACCRDMMLGHLMLALSVTDRLIFVAGHRKKDGWRRMGATRTRRTPCPARWRPAGPKPRGCRRPKIRMDMQLQVEMRRSDGGWLGMWRSGDSSC